MSKAKHTAGPWKVKTNVHPETNGDPWGWVGRDIFGSGDAIPGVSITWTGIKGRDTARLIAEAPSMYEMLKDIHSFLSYLEYEEEAKQIEELIKKIEG